MQSSKGVSVQGKRLSLSNLEKVLYPATGFTKAQVIDYYIRVAPVLLPHLKNRPLTLKRYPNGVAGEFFYEKNCPPSKPPWLRTQPIAAENERGMTNYCLIDDLAALVWVANLADLELHTPLSLARSPERPTMVAFDLDPGAPATLVECCHVALALRKLLEGMGLRGFPKTSGSKGLQVYVPLNTQATFDETKGFARLMAQQIEAQSPERVISKMAKQLRAGKVFVDWGQNDPHKTTVCVYSLRARERPTVSTPITWQEVGRAARRGSADELIFGPDQVLARVARHGDLFAPVLELKQRLPRLRPSAKRPH